VAGVEAYFLDANVLMYAAGGEHPLREPCRAALARAVEREVTLVLDAEVLQEILHRYFSIGRPELARAVYESAVRLSDEVLPIDEGHTARALELLLEHRTQGLTPRDAIHVATMERRGLTRLLSTDRDFDVLSQLERVDPASFASSPR
jgi:predicted nucleic acid-binding protein